MNAIHPVSLAASEETAAPEIRPALGPLDPDRIAQKLRESPARGPAQHMLHQQAADIITALAAAVRGRKGGRLVFLCRGPEVPTTDDMLLVDGASWTLAEDIGPGEIQELLDDPEFERLMSEGSVVGAVFDDPAEAAVLRQRLEDGWRP